MFAVNHNTRFIEKLAYQDARPIIGPLIFPITRYLRASNIMRHVNDKAGLRLLDIGCGDGYFLNRLKNIERFGKDPLLEGEAGNFNSGVDCEDGFFDYVTMLAVIEHLPNPEFVFKEVSRILKPGGLFVFTTPKQKAEWLINLYAQHIEDDHETYFTDETVAHYSKNLFELVEYRPFLFGLNQLFALRKV